MEACFLVTELSFSVKIQVLVETAFLSNLQQNLFTFGFYGTPSYIVALNHPLCHIFLHYIEAFSLSTLP